MTRPAKSSDGAIDLILDHCAEIGFGYTQPVECAKAELAALRERAGRMEKVIAAQKAAHDFMRKDLTVVWSLASPPGQRYLVACEATEALGA